MMRIINQPRKVHIPFMLYIAGQLYWLFVVFKYIKQITNLESDCAV